MKILTGALRGQTLSFTPNVRLRPTADKVRKAIFDALRGALEGAQVLDLFSGTGALGIEALSAGAKAVTFVEIDRRQSSRILENLRRLKLLDRSRVMTADALKAVRDFSRRGLSFDFIFMDPPYGRGLDRKLMDALSESPAVNEGGIVVLECRRNEDAPGEKGRLKMIRSKVYGDARVVIYSRVLQ